MSNIFKKSIVQEVYLQKKNCNLKFKNLLRLETHLEPCHSRDKKKKKRKLTREMFDTSWDRLVVMVGEAINNSY
jgi:hypothetical protein